MIEPNKNAADSNALAQNSAIARQADNTTRQNEENKVETEVPLVDDTAYKGDVMLVNDSFERD